MNTIKAIPAALGVFLAVATVQAQSIWNFDISDAGGGNSLVTWSVTGTLATAPGATLFGPTFQAIAIDTPGIYVNSYMSAGLAQSIPAPDGSYFSTPSAGDAPIIGYYTYAGGSGPDGFGLLISTVYPTHSGDLLAYTPGTQSVLIPVAFSDFNPGTYQVIDNSLFTTPLTVNLTVEAVPEPGTLALGTVAVLSCGLAGRSIARRQKQ